jgi:serine/threonine protein phosphatase PrpC
MPLILRGRSKARVEIHWDGPLPVDIAIVAQEQTEIPIYQRNLSEGDRLQLELNELDFSKLGDCYELHLVGMIIGKEQEQGAVSASLSVQKCQHASCGLWGHAREDGYCKHCGRRIRTRKDSYGFPKLEINNFSLVLWNNVTGHLWKKQESREDSSGIYSMGKYEDKDHSRDYVEILEEKFNSRLAQKFVKLQEVLKKADILDKTWRPPLACFQEEFQRTVWIYYPWLPSQRKWRYISASSYITTAQVDILTITDLVTLGIELCKIAEKIHAQGYVWASLKLADLILCRNKGNNISLYLRSRDIVWQSTPSKNLLDPCLTPLELFWEEPSDIGNGCEVTEVYIIAAILYLLAAKSPNLLSYNCLSYPYGLPTLKLFRLPDQFPLTNISSAYFESTINQALLLNPADRGYRTILEFRSALERLLEAANIEQHGSYRLNIGSALDIGNARREHDLSKNQDDLFITSYTLENFGWGMFVLCDGVSTSTIGSGDLASTIVIETVKEWWRDHESERSDICQCASTDVQRAHTFLNELLSEANRRICKAVRELASVEMIEAGVVMGSTVTVGMVHERTMVYGWLGDSAIYRISAWGWERLNYADNERNYRLREGKPLEDLKEAGNALTLCLGAHFARQEHVQMHFGITELYPEEYILVCSDGIPDYIEPESFYAYHENYQMLRMASVLWEYEKDSLADSRALANMLISTVNRIGGGYDNLAAIIIRPLPENYLSREKSFHRLKVLTSNMQKNMREDQRRTEKVVVAKIPESGK